VRFRPTKEEEAKASGCERMRIVPGTPLGD
jgi:hypothetical protein